MIVMTLSLKTVYRLIQLRPQLIKVLSCHNNCDDDCDVDDDDDDDDDDEDDDDALPTSRSPLLLDAIHLQLY